MTSRIILKFAFVSVCFMAACADGAGQHDVGAETRDAAVADVAGDALSDAVAPDTLRDVADDTAANDDGVPDVVDDVATDAVVETCPSYLAPLILGTLDSTPLGEISGLVASRAHPGVLWGHNDSGDTPRIFAIILPGGADSSVSRVGDDVLDADVPATDAAATDSTASDAGSDAGTVQDGIVTVEFTLNRNMVGWEDLGTDWAKVVTDAEAMSIGPLAGIDGDAIFLADTGDNEKVRVSYRVFVVREPSDLVAADIPDVRVFEFTYSDGPHDCEAFFVDPWTGDLYFVVKELKAAIAGVYRIGANALVENNGQPLTAEKYGDVAVNLATGADMSADGTMLAIRNYSGNEAAEFPGKNNGLFFERTAGMTVSNMLDGTACNLPNFAGDPAYQVQGETVAFKPDNSGIYTVAERVFTPQDLFFWGFDR